MAAVLLSASSQGMAAAASCGICAICLADLEPAEEAFLDACFHHFHLQVRGPVWGGVGCSVGADASTRSTCGEVADAEGAWRLSCYPLACAE